MGCKLSSGQFNKAIFLHLEHVDFLLNVFDGHDFFVEDFLKVFDFVLKFFLVWIELIFGDGIFLSELAEKLIVLVFLLSELDLDLVVEIFSIWKFLGDLLDGKVQMIDLALLIWKLLLKLKNGSSFVVDLLFQSDIGFKQLIVLEVKALNVGGSLVEVAFLERLSVK
jgi:hypothetical protein